MDTAVLEQMLDETFDHAVVHHVDKGTGPFAYPRALPVPAPAAHGLCEVQQADDAALRRWDLKRPSHTRSVEQRLAGGCQGLY
ncbi:hypothetical protein ADK55_01885 [Streptomyces sp. WM4235]|nr:hypothetical protein [Streptomyces sp. WM4235]KOU67968.1 hypothetical protein ADK55_01885 [Streptomyces sp. WM4235]